MPTPLAPNPRASHNGGTPLPLFRQEALLYQQQKFYGEIILIRPFSLTLLTGLVLVLVAGAIGLLGFVHYTEKLRLPVSVSAENRPNLVELHISGRWLTLLQPGSQVSIQCVGCSSPIRKTASVQTISKLPLSGSGAEISGPAYRITLAVPPAAATSLGLDHPLQAGRRLEAEIPLGRKPLIHWFFSRPAS
jgi:hypothetical protein